MADYELRRVDGDATLFHAHAVRRAVFIDEQGVPEDVEMDDNDDDATHFVVYDTDAGHPVATARMRFVGGGAAKAERVAVHSNYRGDGLGTRLMNLVEVEARSQGCSRVELHAQTTVQRFYRNLGYETISEEFEQAGIPHVEMVKEL
jgi:predicted GNAT family N-acyltransferase